MKRAFLPVLALFALSLHAEEKKPLDIPQPVKRKISFNKDIQPILQAKCIECHGPKRQRGGLRLDSRDAALKGGNSGSVIKIGDALHSRLLLVTAGKDPEVKMPPGKRDPLTKDQVALFRAWIEQGLDWPKAGTTVVERPGSDHWAYQKPTHPVRPKVKNNEWVRNPVDAFILARLEEEGITPSHDADRATLIRRLYLDLLGLPPAPEEVDRFVHDTAPDAYERLVERVLASPAYGERWARHWLDAARYADSDGYEKDRGRPFAWRWRHQLIQALNRNQSYDQFVIEQLAGDLLPKATLNQKIATGFHRNTLTNTEGGVDKEQFRVEAVIDRVNTTAKTFLGITLACAQCHDHKYDPFSQREYYRFFAFFNSDQETNIPAPLPGEKYTKKEPSPKAQTLTMGKTRKTHVMIRGDFLRPGVEVKPGAPAVLGEVKNAATRLDLARWIVSKDNPLTARAFVNRIWYRHFGRGLVATIDDFGARGEKSSHPKLLDWLATELMRRQWNIKAFHRLIVTSATYRQSSAVRPEIHKRDPLNVLVSRQSRLRLDAEIIRDSALKASGLLVAKIGGPSVRPPQPKGVSNLTYANSAKWKESQGEDRFRRGLYIWFQRTSPYPMLMTFDASDSNVCCLKRERSCTPLQALTLLNDIVFVEAARALATRIQRECASSDVMTKIERAFRLCLARKPEPREVQLLTRLYQQMSKICQADPREAARLAGVKKPGPETGELAAWIAVCRTMLNLDEMVMRE